ncbi:hypothetical protein HD806DRAFT_482315 [Xylariaceae sp. AK1471]|nr:hypothetical protein HD806DRAFT_482315 [Xylariaceae sp. AK1471]
MELLFAPAIKTRMRLPAFSKRRSTLNALFPCSMAILWILLLFAAASLTNNTWFLVGIGGIGIL